MASINGLNTFFNDALIVNLWNLQYWISIPLGFIFPPLLFASYDQL